MASAATALIQAERLAAAARIHGRSARLGLVIGVLNEAPIRLGVLRPPALGTLRGQGRGWIVAAASPHLHPPMALRLPPFQPLPPADPSQPLLEVAVASLQPTQLCVGLAEVRSRQADFAAETSAERRSYLGTKPVPLVRSRAGALWMVDRHHRLRALLEREADAIAFGYVALEVAHEGREAVLEELQGRGWLYLHDGRGQGPVPPAALPHSLLGLQDDPYRSLVWKLKKEGVIEAAPLIPFHEFRWGAWLRRRPLPPFSSLQLEPALPAARSFARSPAASHLAGWVGRG